MDIKNISHIGDILAIPLFALTTWYFYKIKEKTKLEWILFCFALSGLILDSLFTYLFFKQIRNTR